MTSRLLQTLHETAEDFASIGLIDVQTMREFDALCLPPVKTYSAEEIKALRVNCLASQRVFAAYLNTSPSTVQKWEQGADVVYAVRKTRHDQSKLHIAFTSVFYKLINWRSRVKIPANAGDFRLMGRNVVQALQQMPERNRFMKGLYAWVGFNSTAIDYEPLPREDGQSNYGFRGALSLAVTGLLAFSVAPLRLVSYFGLFLSIAALGYGAWVVFDYFWFGADTPGYATIVVGMMFLSGIQLLSIGILAEYVGRIYEEVKQRPTYLLRSRIGKGLDQP